MPRPPASSLPLSLVRERMARPGSLLWDAAGRRPDRAPSLLLSHPVDQLEAWEPEQVAPLLDRAEAALAAHPRLRAALMLSYEAGRAFGLQTRPPMPRLPLAWVGLYEQALPLRESDWQAWGPPPDIRPGQGRFSLDQHEFCRCVRQAQDWIADGETYQLNLTMRYRFDLPHGAEALDFYRRLRAAQPVPYGALLNLGPRQLLSLSPELFLWRQGDLLRTRPMKGTAPRGRGWREDEARRRALARCPKNRAENVMIVDLLRNDIGRICRTGSVRVPRLFRAERYATVHQLTSTVEGRLRPDRSLREILAACFPSGSVTGAPKIRTMLRIAQLETEPRGAYCGALGLMGPGPDRLCLNVAIRSLLLEDRQGLLGIGAGITTASDPEAEWHESLLKADFLSREPADFGLIETLLWERQSGFTRLEAHLRRLRHSARYWGRPFPEKRLRREIDDWTRNRPEPARVLRIELAPDGSFALSDRSPELSLEPPYRALLRPERLDDRQSILCHKTTRRDLYNRALAEARAAGFLEALFLNRHGRLAEGAHTNLFVLIDEGWRTPPLDEGLLPGVWREAFLASTGAREAPIPLETLACARRLVVGNSVRGAMEIESLEDDSGQVLFQKKSA